MDGENINFGELEEKLWLVMKEIDRHGNENGYNIFYDKIDKLSSNLLDHIYSVENVYQVKSKQRHTLMKSHTGNFKNNNVAKTALYLGKIRALIRLIDINNVDKVYITDMKNFISVIDDNIKVLKMNFFNDEKEYELFNEFIGIYEVDFLIGNDKQLKEYRSKIKNKFRENIENRNKSESQ